MTCLRIDVRFGPFLFLPRAQTIRRCPEVALDEFQAGALRIGLKLPVSVDEGVESLAEVAVFTVAMVQLGAAVLRLSPLFLLLLCRIMLVQILRDDAVQVFAFRL